MTMRLLVKKLKLFMNYLNVSEFYISGVTEYLSSAENPSCRKLLLQLSIKVPQNSPGFHLNSRKLFSPWKKNVLQNMGEDD